jgi:DNA-directed RNA polymerase subunit RPC12/RpoP
MSEHLTRLRGANRLNLGGGGDRKMEIVMVAGLVVIILGSLTYTIYHFAGGGRGGQVGEPPEIRYKCTQCGHEFKPELKEEQAWEMAEGMQALDCPSCGKKDCAHIMTKCPKCGHHYLAPSTLYWSRYYATGVEPPKQAEPPKDICPNCGTDREQYIREQIRKRREERGR